MERRSIEAGTTSTGFDLLGSLSKATRLRAAERHGRGERWDLRTTLVTAALVFCVHGAASVFLPQHGSVTCLGIGGCYALACVAAWMRGRRQAGMMRTSWMLVSLGLGLGVLSFALTLYRECIERVPEGLAGIQDVTLLLRGLPFLMAVSLSRRERSRVFVRLDVVQGVLAVCLAFIALQLASNTGYLPVSSDSALTLIVAANVLAAFLAVVRWLGREDPSETRFFGLVACFLAVNALVTGWVNFYVIRRWQVLPGSPWLMLGDLPVLSLLLAFPQFDSRKRAEPVLSRNATWVDTAGPLLVSLWILLLAASIVPNHLYVGMAGVAFVFLLYGVRSTLLLKQSEVVHQELRRANERIQDQALSDGLSGIPNRRSFDLTLEREWKRAQRSKQPLALLMIDIDRFKDLNDRHGHLVGDGCLREIAGILRAGLGREADFVARYGGEEFAVLLMDTGIEGGRIVGESLRRGVEQHSYAAPDGTALTFTISIGVASEIPLQQESSVTLVGAADKALYRAKRSGRNRVEIHEWRSMRRASDEALLLDRDA